MKKRRRIRGANAAQAQIWNGRIWRKRDRREARQFGAYRR